MTDTLPLVPHGISHDPDLSAMPYAERMKFYRRQIQEILPTKGKEGKDAFVARYPEAAAVRTRSLHRAYIAKPPQYIDALAAMVSLWFDSTIGLGQTNKADVTRLNEKLGTTFPATNHFNVRLSLKARERLADVFKLHGAYLDTGSADTLSKVRKAVRAAKEAAQPDCIAFGPVGHRTLHTLAIGEQTFTIEKNGSRECIRPRIGGSKQRLYLDGILWLADVLAQADPEGASPYSLRSKLIERAYSEETTRKEGQTAPPPRATTDSLGLSDRIRNYAAARRAAEEVPLSSDGTDPLALI